MKNRLMVCKFLLAGTVALGMAGCAGSKSMSSNPNPPPGPPPKINEWTWKSGANVVNQTGIFGMKGVASPNNSTGDRVYANTWTDKSGNLWLFGGYGDAATPNWGDLNDLWMYSSTTGEWTWEGGSNTTEQAGVYGTKGVPSPNNYPGARYQAASWTDTAGNFWLFGGLGIDGAGNRGRLGDLWKYSPATNGWTWIGGPDVGFVNNAPGAVYGTKGVAASGNMPGGRVDAMSWTDPSDNLWLFGGLGYDSSGGVPTILNDLWKYDISTGEWTWVNGSNQGNQNGVYGTEGVAASGNVPGARGNALTWTDAEGNLWLFGGAGNDENAQADCPAGSCYLNDLWKYDPATNEWTWVSGSNTANQPGVFGAQGVAAPGNVPPPRDSAVAWTDPSGNFWLFGGDAGPFRDFNDLWKYDPTSNEWTWVSGSSTPVQLGVYGTKGVAASTNVPGARDAAVGWTDKSGNLWLFGGEDTLSVGGGVGGGGKFNDLWEYQP